MKPIILFNRILSGIIRKYRRAVFKAKTGCSANLVGRVTLINQNIKCGKNVTIYPDVMFYGDGKIEIGDNSSIGNGTIIYASKFGGVVIGSNTLIAAQCYVIDCDHGITHGECIKNQKNTVEPVRIGSDVWLGANVTVLKGSSIEDGAVIGAKSLVKGKINSNMIAFGIPAREKRCRE